MREKEIIQMNRENRGKKGGDREPTGWKVLAIESEN